MRQIMVTTINKIIIHYELAGGGNGAINHSLPVPKAHNKKEKEVN